MVLGGYTIQCVLAAETLMNEQCYYEHPPVRCLFVVHIIAFSPLIRAGHIVYFNSQELCDERTTDRHSAL
jgi:hypothetical protein